MLTDEDILLVRKFREELVDKRTEPVTLFRETVISVDPYTKEEETQVVEETVQALVRGFTSERGLRMTVGGIGLDVGNIFVTFDEHTSLEGVNDFEIYGIRYAIYSIEPRGLGTNNRLEVVGNRVT